jgi:transposase InsO family protein
LLQVSSSGYYSWLRRPASYQSLENAKLVEEMREIESQVGQTYGSPRMYAELRARGYSCSLNRVARLMRQHGIIAKMTVRFRRLTKAGKRKPAAPNILDRQFQVARPNRVWASDITYIKTAEGHLYLAVVIDLYSRQVVGWSMSSRLNPDLVVTALSQAVGRRELRPGLLHHSDRDTLYSCDAYQWVLSRHGMLKTEYVSFEKFRSREEAQLKIFAWIEIFYNRIRRHSTLNYLSPVDFENKKT